MKKFKCEIVKNSKIFILYREEIMADRCTIKATPICFIYNCQQISSAYIKGRFFARKDYRNIKNLLLEPIYSFIHYDDDYPYCITFNDDSDITYFVKEA